MQKIYLAFGLSVVLAACGDSESTRRGGAGESCAGQNDCSGALVCLNNVCQNPGLVPVTPDGGGTPITPVTPAPVLSGIGESCTKTADCVSGAKCFDGTCALSAPLPPDAAVIYVVVDAGAPTNPVLGGRGETCTRSSDCETGLICLPISSTTGLGVCDKKTYGFTTGTKTCYAECNTNADCCELPLGLTVTMPDAGTVPVNSCADIVKAMRPATPADCNDVPAVAHECFLYKTYCNCAASNYWVCSDQKQCVYNNSCDPTVGSDTMKGCPSKSRAGFALPACNTTTKVCANVAVAGGCKNNDECTGMGVADGAGETCAAGECVCVVGSGACYRRCNAELDCAPGYTCDTTQQLCKPAGECTTNSFCATKLKNAGAECVTLPGTTSKTCRLPCNSDQDCSPSGLAGSAFSGLICGADHFCGSMGCTSDLECSSAADTTGVGSVKMFCAAPVAATVVEWTSAITD